VTQPCLTCDQNAAESLPPREEIWRNEHWRVAHAFDTALPGWLVVLARRHVVALDELDSDAASELGRLLHQLTAALRAVTGCEKTYVMMLGEAEGFSHLHVHVVPRMPDLPEDLRGPRVFGLLGVEEEDRVTTDARDAVARALQRHLDQVLPALG
jgi:diadenosine tetraphosphate (Ap4A) HIT family hydrolase